MADAVIYRPLALWRRLAPDRVALVERRGDERLTYAELHAAARRRAASLASLGLGTGDRVAVLAAGRRELADLLFACGHLGCVLAPLNWRLSAAELAGILGDCRPAALVVGDRFRTRAEDAVRRADAAPGSRDGEPFRDADLMWIDLDRDSGASEDSAPAPAPVGPEHPLLLLYTSGSTGRPKGALIPHRQVLHNAIATTTAWELGSDDVAPITTPLFHTGGWNVFATPLWHRGGRVVLLDGFDADGFLDVMAEEACTVSLTVPTMLRMLRESPSWGRELPALRSLFSGGAPCPPALAAEVREAGYPLREGYGLTECGPNCFAISLEEARARPGSVGWPVPFLETRLVTEEGVEVDVGEEGELQLRGPQVFGGYLDDPERTEEAFAAGGWLRTGDLARRDRDGAFHIRGRRKEMFISGGENVYPGEVEAVLAECPGVAEVAVIGVPDERWGEVGRAFVVAGDAELRDEVTTSDRVLAFARDRLAGYKVPASVVLAPELPRLGSGKIDRKELAARAARTHGPPQERDGAASATSGEI